MPGLVGLVTSLPRDRALLELRFMVASMCHESFYVTSWTIHEAEGVYAASVALRDSSAAVMPLTNERRDVTILFSGEDLSSGAMTQITGVGSLTSRYEDKPESFLPSLNGRFHGLVVDARRRLATIFVDRYGMHRLYYHQGADTFYFAAEAKAILAVRHELRRLDQRGVGELVSNGCVLENRTLFDGIEVLPAASAWSFDTGNHSPKKGQYFSRSEWETQSGLDDETYYREVRDVFSRRLTAHFSGSQRVGVSLTGGLDSRMILAWHPAAPDTVPCYTFGGPFRENHDVRIAARISRLWGQRHHVIRLGDEFLRNFGRLAERAVYMTDGCVDVSRAADLYVNEQAREIAPVRLTGNYGGELLRGVRAFKPMPAPNGLFVPEFERHVRQAAATYHDLDQIGRASFNMFRQTPWFHYGLSALEHTQLMVRSPFLDNDVVRTVFRASQSASVGNEVSLRLIAEGSPALAAVATDAGLGGLRGPIASEVFRRWRHLQFRFEYAYDYGMPSWLVRTDSLLSPLRPERLFLGRHKFFHYRLWYRDALARTVQEILLDPRSLSRSYLNAPAVSAAVRGHVNGQLNATLTIHKLLTLEHIHRLFIDGQGIPQKFRIPSTVPTLDARLN